jgi:DsbC/DsbD-like thiol-disulfide interchange protein
MDAASVVTATLLLAPAGVPGVDGPVAVLDFQLKKDWHIYWENSGDTGLPTEFEVKTPGVEQGEPVWSVPHQIARPGDLTDFGYERHATIVVPLSALPENGGSVTATVRYLVCRADSCIPGVAELTLSKGEAELYDMPTPVVAQRTGDVATVALPGVTQAEVFPDLVLAELGVSTSLADGVLTIKAPESAHGTVLIRGKGKGGEVFYGVEL